ncbi:uncharacterized protein LOC131876826 isoform X1 [Tigriopus californicus]|uniref:uncharacterized protein LOC131876826 isoform X1 n=1 Tax=Tigriopus californicus TaxID=6832 RepID=UPI0027D9DBEA|nr:uncharacterized protein LOC131876826 isoform X1 [Tigriopus californicus]
MKHNRGYHPIFTWFPRKEDYEAPPTILVTESIQEKVARLLDTIQNNQANIKEIVDGDSVGIEDKIFRTMDLRQDMDDLANLHKECESSPMGKNFQEDLKKAKVGMMNLKAYLTQVDTIEFATAIRNEFQFEIGRHLIFVPWLNEAEIKIRDVTEKPKSFEEAREAEQNACLALKSVVKANNTLKLVQAACDGVKGANVKVKEDMARMQERYYVLCKRAEQKVKNIQHLLVEWKRMEDLLIPTNLSEKDDYIPKQVLIFLRTYALYFS